MSVFFLDLNFAFVTIELEDQCLRQKRSQIGGLLSEGILTHLILFGYMIVIRVTRRRWKALLPILMTSTETMSLWIL